MGVEHIQLCVESVLSSIYELMMKLWAFSLASASLTALITAQNGSYIPDTISISLDQDLNNLPNNSLYFRWRQTYHIQPPGGHMNDPCGPMYDPNRGLYHIFYQSFPQHVSFGNTSWSHATSPDMVNWTDVGGWENRSMVAIPTGPFPQYDVSHFSCVSSSH
jgi:beta-fructofuranosidase